MRMHLPACSTVAAIYWSVGQAGLNHRRECCTSGEGLHQGSAARPNSNNQRPLLTSQTLVGCCVAQALSMVQLCRPPPLVPLSSGVAGLGLKAVWYGAEQFGNVLGLTKRKQASKSEAAAPPKARRDRSASAAIWRSLQSDSIHTHSVLTVQVTRDTALASIRRDYDSNYFVSGVGDMEAYEPDWCAPWRVLARSALLLVHC